MTTNVKYLKAGSTFKPTANARLWSAGIDIGNAQGESEHDSAIECHAMTKELALARRDMLLDALAKYYGQQREYDETGAIRLDNL